MRYDIIEAEILFSKQKIKCFDDVAIGASLKQYGYWEYPFSQFFINSVLLIYSVHRDFIFLDLGAHIGYYSILFKYYAPSAQVYSVEPNLYNFQLLESNISGYPDCILKNVAITPENKDYTFYSCQEETGGGSVDISATSPNFKQLVSTVHGITIDNLGVDWNKVLLIKIDTQDQEVNVMKSLYPLISHQCLCFVEKNPPNIEFLSTNLNLFDIVADCGNTLAFYKK